MATTKTEKRAAALNYDLFRAENITVLPPATLDAKIREHETSCAAARIEKFRAHNGQLPTPDELQRMFDLINWLYFEGELPRVRIEYSTRMSAAGSYSPRSKLIKIGVKYHRLFPDEIGDTLKHEMIHIKHFNHDATFHKEAERLGASVKAKDHPLLRKPPRYVYICPHCGQKYPRQKRFRMASCGDCSRGGRFDARYKLVLFASEFGKAP